MDATAIGLTGIGFTLVSLVVASHQYRLQRLEKLVAKMADNHTHTVMLIQKLVERYDR